MSSDYYYSSQNQQYRQHFLQQSRSCGGGSRGERQPSTVLQYLSCEAKSYQCAFAVFPNFDPKLMPDMRMIQFSSADEMNQSINSPPAVNEKIDFSITDGLPNVVAINHWDHPYLYLIYPTTADAHEKINIWKQLQKSVIAESLPPAFVEFHKHMVQSQNQIKRQCRKRFY